MSLQEEKYQDGSSTLVPVDANRTKGKIFAGIDRFIEEYAGEDLRIVAVRDANKYLTTCIENEVKEQDREQKKINTLSLTVDDIDWEDNVLTGKISSLYVAQLHLYSEHKIGMTCKEIRAKGFTHVKKVEAIQRHVLGQPNKSSDNVSCSTSSKLARMTTPAQTVGQKFDSNLNILPWGGKSLNFELTNTCQMDNFLFIIHTLMITHDKEMNSICDPLYTI